MIKTINIKNGKTSDLYKYLSSAITPRPIALVSSINANGAINLSPFSFFNVFSVDPPVLVFSPVRRVRDNSSKHTLDNVENVKECVIALVTEDMAQQVSLASCDYPDSVNEFKKAGFTEIESEFVKPPRIKESPINFECKINEIIKLGNQGGAGNLVLAEVIKMHINTSILDRDKNIDPFKLKLISRHGGGWYGKTTKDSLFEIPKPVSRIGMGIDNLPNNIRNSKVLTGSDLAILASFESVPEKSNLDPRNNIDELERHKIAKNLIGLGDIEKAWQILL